MEYVMVLMVVVFSGGFQRMTMGGVDPTRLASAKPRLLRL